MINNKIHQLPLRATMPTLPSAFFPVLLLILSAAGLLSSCLDETLVSTTYGNSSSDDTDMYLSINVPRTYAVTGTPTVDKENLIETLDVLVFSSGAGAPDDQSGYSVYATAKGTFTKDGKTFQVVMPVGKGFIVHAFINCSKELEAKDFYNSKGMEMNTALKKFTVAANPNADRPMPMHGYVANVDIEKDMAYKNLTISVLRSVASVQVMTNATQIGGTADAPVYTPGTITDAKSFSLRELYVYFYPNSGQIAANSNSYETSETDATRNVARPSLPTPSR
ncbi:MAG: fimbrial protein [Bacteroides sp.]|nr:fimbrial protein [Bacteroides sp.]